MGIYGWVTKKLSDSPKITEVMPGETDESESWAMQGLSDSPEVSGAKSSETGV